MTWRRICDKPLSEPMLIRFIDVYMWRQGEMGYEVFTCDQPIADRWNICKSVNWHICGTGIGLSPVWHQVNSWTKRIWLIVNWTQRKQLQWNLNQNRTTFPQEIILNEFPPFPSSFRLVSSNPLCVSPLQDTLWVRGPPQCQINKNKH